MLAEMNMKSEAPKFSVIIPNFNNGETLARAIDSVLIQSFPAHEIIIVDDGSTDNTQEVAKKYSNKIKYIHQQNQGVSAARNLGASSATGNWLTFLDADDTYLPHRLELHANWISKDDSIDFLLGDQEFRTPSGDLLHLTIDACEFGRQKIAQHGNALEIPLKKNDFEDLIADGFGEIRTLSVPRTTFIEIGGFPVNQKIGEDLHFVIRLCARSSRAGIINSPLAIYYIYPGSALRRNVIDSQSQFVQALEALNKDLTKADKFIRRGYQKKLRQARLSLAYAYLRNHRKLDAIRSVLPSLLRKPSLQNVKDFLSIARGFS